MKKVILFLGVFVFLSTGLNAEVIGESKSSGFMLKDTITVNAEDDPDYLGIVCYTTSIELGGLNFENPSDSSIACRLVGDISSKKLVDKRNVFVHSKNPFFKKLVVDRFYDKRRNVLVYLSYTKKMSGKNSSHSISVVPLGDKIKK